MPEDARKGWELVIEKLADLPDDATKEDVEAAQNLTAEEQEYSDGARPVRRREVRGRDGRCDGTAQG